MIDIRTTREAFDRNEVTNFEWVSSKDHIPDRITKIDHCESMEIALCGELMVLMIEQCIKRSSPTNNYLGEQNSEDESDSHHKGRGVLVSTHTVPKAVSVHDTSALAQSNYDTFSSSRITDTATCTQFIKIHALTNHSTAPTITPSL